MPALPTAESLFGFKRRKPVPHEFVLEAIAQLSPVTRPMFGCLAVYVRDQIVFVLRDKREPAADNGVWLATTVEHHRSLRGDFPSMRSIQVFGKKVTGWQVLPADAPDFEEAALRACDFVIGGDPRIGKVPASRRTAQLYGGKTSLSRNSRKAERPKSERKKKDSQNRKTTMRESGKSLS